MDKYPKIIGLTGKMAAGKTTAGKIFARAGAYVVDVDAVGHQLLERPGPTSAIVVNYFGSGILDADEAISRTRLSRLIAACPDLYPALNSLTHPVMRREVIREIDEARKKGARVVVLDAAMLLEMGLNHLADEIWLIAAPDEVLRQRLAAGYRDLTQVEIDSRLKAQTNGAAAKASLVIDNSGTLEHFVADIEHKVKTLFQERV